MTILYANLAKHYPSSNPGSRQYVSQTQLFESIGWKDFLKDPNYANTCAIRVSLALIATGKFLHKGSHRVLKGPYARKWIQVNMKRLSELLAEPAYFGKPEIYKIDTVHEIGKRRGIIAFHRIAGYSGGGHIDLYDALIPAPVCLSACYAAEEIWFWALQ